MTYESQITITISRTGRAYNFVGSNEQLDPFTSLADALEWASFIGFTHYEMNGTRRRISTQHR